MGTLVAVLFVLQLLSFYFIAILYAKVSKFQDLERKQEQLMREMDDMVGAYLLEMREENDRLIDELSKPKKTINDSPRMSVTNLSVTNKELASTSVESPKVTQQVQILPKVQESANDIDLETKALVPKAVATKAYAKQKMPTNISKVEPQIQDSIADISTTPEKEMTFEEEVKLLAGEGKTAEEIAKMMQKGKTEIELLLKFHS